MNNPLQIVMTPEEFRQFTRTVYEDGYSDGAFEAEHIVGGHANRDELLSARDYDFPKSVSFGYIEEAVKTFQPKHVHVNRGDGTDTCAECGEDLRHYIHQRSEATAAT